MKVSIAMALLVSMLIANAGTDTDINADEMIFVDSSWLAQHLTDNNLIIIDARTSSEFEKGHITNAVNIPMKRTYKPTKNIYKIGDLRQIQLLFSQAGIEHNKRIIIYGDSTYLNSSRVYYVFEAYGHKKLSVLEAGYPGWIRNSTNPVSTKTTKPKVTDYTPRIEPNRILSKFEMQLAISDADKIILDSRPLDHFQGKASVSDRFGKIPTAINMPANDNYIDVDGLRKLKSMEELTKMYAHIDPSKKIYLYCNEGLNASRTYAVMRLLGFDIAQYDGSWYEWGYDHKLPIESAEIRD